MKLQKLDREYRTIIKTLKITWRLFRNKEMNYMRNQKYSCMNINIKAKTNSKYYKMKNKKLKVYKSRMCSNNRNWKIYKRQQKDYKKK